jgi:putative ABC transport system permease protein
MVLQRTGDIAILKSSGASGWFIVRQILGESILLTGGGVVVGLVMAFAVAWAVETWAPLHTVTITWQWVGIAILAAGIGAIISALYPARQAMRVDIAEALTLK